MVNKQIKVPYLDLKASYKKILPQLQTAFTRVLESGMVVLGNEVKEFEEKYAQFSNTKYAVGVACGLDALILSLSSLGIGKGDEVIVPSNTYVATLIAVSRVGATPILVESKIDTYNIDPEKIEKSITKKTKAIIPVHLFGQACEMDKILKIAEKYKLKIVEDNAQSQGATYNGKITGSFGNINATSFYPGKNFGAIGDGGGITTNSKKYYKLILQLRNYGERKKYYNNLIGFNSRLDELQAAFLKIRISQIDDINKKKNKIAQIYIKNLSNVGDLILPKTHQKATHVFHVFCIRTKKRDLLKDYLLKKGIITLIHYPVPGHLQEAYKNLGYKKGDLTIAEELAKTSLSLPIYPEITSDKLEYVIDSIKKFFK